MVEPYEAQMAPPVCDLTYTRAVKSAHEPIEVWRRVPGFVEDADGVRR